MEVSLIDQGVSLMLFGMGTVFVFLTILVFATSLMSRIVNQLNPEIAKISESSPMQTATANQANARVISVIEKAIATHRANK